VATPVTSTPEGPVDGAAKARWTRLAALALVLVALGPLLMFAAGLLWGLDMSEDAVFFLGTAAVALIGAVLVARFGTWAKVVGVITAVLAGGALFWTAFGLAAPNSFFDFMPGVLVLPGAITAIVACVAAIVAGRRRHATVRAERGERTAIRMALGVVVVAAVASAALTLVGGSDASGSGDLQVVATDFEFDPETFEVAAGDSILVRNDDPFMHTFTIDHLGIDETLNPGSSVLIEVPDEGGTHIFYCRPHTSEPDDPSEEDMTGELSIQ
jgi:plastocyanin